VLLPETAATKFSLATVTVTFGSFTETLVAETIISALLAAVVNSCTTALPCDTKALVVSGKFSFISVPSTNTTYSKDCDAPFAVPAEPLIGRELIPLTATFDAGEYVPFAVVTDHRESVDFTTIIEF